MCCAGLYLDHAVADFHSFRTPFFQEVLRSDCPWTAAFVRSEVFCDMMAERLAAVITMPVLMLRLLHLADNTSVGVFQDFVSWWLLYTAMTPGNNPSDSAVMPLLKQQWRGLPSFPPLNHCLDSGGK